MQTKFPLFLLLTGLGISLLSGCSTAEDLAAVPPATTSPITLTDGLDRSISLEKPAQRVVSLAPSSTEILYAIGAGGQVVGRDTFSDYPEQVKSIPDIGGGFGELNTEIIIAQKPDLVLAGSLTPPEQIKSLENLGLKVFVVANPPNFEGVFGSIKAIALLTGHEDQAMELIAGLNKRLEAVIAKTSTVIEHPLVFYELDGTDPNAPWTPGPGSYIDHLITLAGGENLGGRLSSEWAQISIEELIAQDPEIILIGDATWGGVTVDDVKARQSWETLGAIQNGRLYTFDDNLVSRPGPRMLDGLEQMAKLIHPELFP